MSGLMPPELFYPFMILWLIAFTIGVSLSIMKMRNDQQIAMLRAQTELAKLKVSKKAAKAKRIAVPTAAPLIPAVAPMPSVVAAPAVASPAVSGPEVNVVRSEGTPPDQTTEVEFSGFRLVVDIYDAVGIAKGEVKVLTPELQRALNRSIVSLEYVDLASDVSRDEVVEHFRRKASREIDALKSKVKKSA